MLMRYTGVRLETREYKLNGDGQTGDISNMRDLLSPIVESATEVYTDINTNGSGRSFFSRFIRGSSSKSTGFAKILESSKVKPLRPMINELRVMKSEAEIVNMRKAGQASGRAFTDAMRQTFTREKDLAAYLDYGFKKQGCDTWAYIPVVAGGENGLKIHYVRNDDVLRKGDMVLVDAGGECGGYITDITRCWPNGGKFTDPQKDLYNAVLNVQRTCVSLCRESAGLSLDKLHEVAENGLKDQLKQLGFDMSASVRCSLHNGKG